jgi:mannosyltransferase OCH1-like enzyme
MIPKIIHYSWISNDPYPEKIQKCIDSWKEKLPDYQFINWNRDTFDFDSVQWLREAYEDKNWAYCADFLRIQALYHYGGIWLDTDVEVIKSFNDLLDLPYFLGVEPFFGEKKFNELGIEAAVMGTEKHSPIFSCVLNPKKKIVFIMPLASF